MPIGRDLLGRHFLKAREAKVTLRVRPHSRWVFYMRQGAGNLHRDLLNLICTLLFL